MNEKGNEKKQKRERETRILTVHPDLAIYIWIELLCAEIETHFHFYSTMTNLFLLRNQ